MESNIPRRSKKLADETFLAAMAFGATVENAAAKAGISKRTAFRCLKDPEFQKRLGDLKSEIVRRSSGMLTVSTLEAIKALLELLNPSTPPAVRRGVARDIIQLGMRMRESSDMEVRLAALEEQMQTNTAKSF